MKLQDPSSIKEVEMQISQLIDEYLKRKKEEKKTCSPTSKRKVSDCDCDFDNDGLATIIDCICGAKNSKDSLERKKFKRNSHQYRLPSKTIVQTNELLEKNKGELNKVKDFNNFHDLVDSLIKKHNETAKEKISNFGPLARYDFSLRYCKNLKIEPDHIYFHAGTMEGAKGLMKLGILNKNIFKGNNDNAIRVPAEDFKFLTGLACFNKLNAAQIEDFLCIYKKEINNLKK